jgi:cation diffusion facilitator CzcD-associated flavoprotein CzcO
VVGGGNSGLDIAADLAAGGARPVRLAIRTPPHIVRRELLGVPNDVWGVALRPLGPPAIDRVGRLVRRVGMPGLERLGLPEPRIGLGTSVARGRISTVDPGDGLARIRAGQVEVVGEVRAFDGRHVLLRGGRRLAPALVVAATGYRSVLPGLVGHLGVLDAAGRPRTQGAAPALPGLWLVGFVHPISGNLRELRLDGRRVAAAVAAWLAGPRPARGRRRRR